MYHKGLCTFPFPFLSRCEGYDLTFRKLDHTVNTSKSGFPAFLLLSALLCQNCAQVCASLVRVKTLDLSKSKIFSLAFYLISVVLCMLLT